MDLAQPPVVRVEGEPDGDLDPRRWPRDIRAVAQVLREGLPLSKGVTFLVGENGSGKSTLVEGVAMAYGLGSEGGSRGSLHATRSSESTLHRSLRIQRGLGAGRWGFFLRAETMHGLYTYLENNPGGGDPVFHELSHGESFLAALPGATLLELGDWGIRERRWEDLELVWHWRRFLGTPEAYLRHLAD